MLRREGCDLDEASSDDEEDDFDVNTFFHFMFGMQSMRNGARVSTFVFRC